MLNRLIDFALDNGIIVAVLVVLVVAGGIAVMPFPLGIEDAAFRDPIPVDAIPDISQHQVIVAADWPGRSPRDVEDQVTYPLSTQLQGVPGVVDVRAISGFGMSRVYVVFDDATDFYWARSRVLEKLATIGGDLPDGVEPALGPDATPLGQIFWYTVDGANVGLDELRAVQDFQVKYALQAVDGVAEVASVGGQVREYHVNVDPERLRGYGIDVHRVVMALKNANLDVGARTFETPDGGMEYLVRGVGFIASLADIENTPVGTVDHVPLTIRDVANVTTGPAFRRGALAGENGERVGGVVVMRFGENPQAVIDRVKAEISRLNQSLAGRGITITPFYDRTQLIQETLGTLSTALWQELLITVVVVLLFLLHVRTSLIVASTLPLAVFAAFIGMRVFGIDSNLMSLAGIAIAIGTMVDMAIIMAENAYNYLLDDADSSRPPNESVRAASHEVAGAIVTAILTTVVSFVPVFFLTGEAGKLFKPLAWTKTFCLVGAAIFTIVLVPILCRQFLKPHVARLQRWIRLLVVLAVGVLVGIVVRDLTQPAPHESGIAGSVYGLFAGVLVAFLVWRASRETLTSIEKNPVSRLIVRAYQPTLRWILAHKKTFLLLPLLITVAGFIVWLGGGALLWPYTASLQAMGVDTEKVAFIQAVDRALPGIGQEFMPPLDEGSLLYMPSLLPAASLSEVMEQMQRQNRAMRTVPEVASVMGKLGRAETALDPAPVGMIETVVNLRPRDQWRPGISIDDIVNDLRDATAQLGVTPSWLQPIETRIVMLQSGIKANIAMKAYGTDPASLEAFCAAAEPIIRSVPGTASVSTQRTNGKPYLEYHIDRERAAHFGVSINDAQEVIQTALGGMPVTRTVEGRERFDIRVRFPRERLDDLDDLRRLLVRTNTGALVPIEEVADIHIRPGPAAIMTENGFAYSYVAFEAQGRDEVSVVKDVRAAVESAIVDGRLVPPEGMTGFDFVGRYESQVRAAKRLSVLVPVVLVSILFLVYMQFRRGGLTLLVFSAIPVAFAGGFLFIAAWPWVEQAIYWLDHALLAGTYPVPRLEPVYLTTAVWVGFIALFGIAVDDGIVMTTYIKQTTAKRQPSTVAELREAVLIAGTRRVRPCLMTSFTTLFALLPVLWATGRGADVMKPIALPVFGGMLVVLVSLFVVPALYAAFAERALLRANQKEAEVTDEA